MPIPVHRSPLGWLRHDRRGIVIVDWEIAPFGLNGLLLKAEDEDHREELQRGGGEGTPESDPASSPMAPKQKKFGRVH